VETIHRLKAEEKKQAALTGQVEARKAKRFAASDKPTSAAPTKKE